MDRYANKLDYQWIGPFMISDQMNDVAFCFDLPPHMYLDWNQTFVISFQIGLFQPSPIQLLDDPKIWSQSCFGLQDYKQQELLSRELVRLYI